MECPEPIFNGSQYTHPPIPWPQMPPDQFLLINTNLLTNNWKQIPIPYPDITAIELSGTYGKTQIFNIYNNCKNNDALNHISTFMTANPIVCSATMPIQYIWLGDFNHHHPLWDEP